MTSQIEGFAGSVFSQGEDAFEPCIQNGQWNKLAPDRRPSLIARVANVEDVCLAIRFAKEHNLKVAIRGGGHNWVSPCLREGGMMIDLQDLTNVVSIDPEQRIAAVEPIISNREIQQRLRPFGLAFPSGHCPQVKLSGYLLSGGMSWNHGVWGAGCGSVEAIEMVTADGELVIASATENADLFWAARGAGPGFFGVCVRYHLRLYALPQQIRCTAYSFSLDDAVEVASWLGPLADQLTPNVELSLFMLNKPEPKCMVTATVFADSKEEADLAVAPLEACPLMDRCTGRSFSEESNFEGIFDLSGSLWPSGLRNRVDAMFSNRPLVELTAATVEHFKSSPSDLTVLMFAAYTGGSAPATPDNACFSMTGKLYGGPWTMWETAAEDKANHAWHEEAVRLLEPLVCGHYISESDTVHRPDFVAGSYLGDELERLAALRTKHDPDGRFFDCFEALR